MARDEFLSKLKAERYLSGPEIINIYKIFGTLTTITPLHIGSGQFGKAKDRTSEEDGENCALIERDYCRRPCIPGSSIRGVIRSYLETNLMPFNSRGLYDVVILSTAEFEIQKGITNDDIADEKKRLRDEANKKGLKEAIEVERYVINGMAKFYLRNLDLVSCLFGFGRFKGRIEFNTAYLKKPDEWSDLKVFTMPGVAIDRVTGTAKEKSLFTYEVVSPHVEFMVELTLRNVRYWELGMLFVAINAINHPYFPLRIGGLTNNGYGQMKWEIDKIYQIGDDDAKTAGEKVRKDFQHIFGDNGDKSWELFSIDERGFKDMASFETKCIEEFKKVLDEISNGES